MRPYLAVLTCALMLGPGLLYAQDTPVPAATPPVGTAAAQQVPAARPQGRITGTVFCNDTHKPARGALVLVSALPGEGQQPGGMNFFSAMARVGNDGTYTAEHLAPGEYAAIAFQPGYLSGMEDVLNDSFQKLSHAKQREALGRGGTAAIRGAEAATLNITLERGATLSGRVLYSDGAPATQITLTLENAASKSKTNEEGGDNEALSQAMIRGLFAHQTMSTDDQGNFRLSGLQPGSYRLAATQPPGSPMDDSQTGDDGFGALLGSMPDAHALRFYAGDTAHRASAKVFDLRAGDQVDGVEITIPVSAFHTIRGSVTAVDGRAVNLGSLTLTDSGDDTLVFKASIDRDGTFRVVQVPAGTYTLKVTGARIGKIQRTAGSPPQIPDANFPLEPTNAFADKSTPVIVKENDVSDLTLSLNEIPLPKSDIKP